MTGCHGSLVQLQLLPVWSVPRHLPLANIDHITGVVQISGVLLSVPEVNFLLNAEGLKKPVGWGNKRQLKSEMLFKPCESQFKWGLYFDNMTKVNFCVKTETRQWRHVWCAYACQKNATEGQEPKNTAGRLNPLIAQIVYLSEGSSPNANIYTLTVDLCHYCILYLWSKLELHCSQICETTLCSTSGSYRWPILGFISGDVL